MFENLIAAPKADMLQDRIHQGPGRSVDLAAAARLKKRRPDDPILAGNADEVAQVLQRAA